MGITDQIAADYEASLAALAWQVDLGADEALAESPVCAYDLPEKPSYSQRPAAAPAVDQRATAPAARPPADGLAMAQMRAEGCSNLAELEAAAAQFDLCELHKGARGAAAAIGPATAALLILCDPPPLEAEKSGLPMASADLDHLLRFFALIGLSPDAPQAGRALHLASVLPWPLRGSPEMHTEALHLMRPFALRRIALVQPKAVVVMGHSALAQVLPGAGLMRLRGQWQAAQGTPLRALPLPLPSAALKGADAKRALWADLLAIKDALAAT